MVLRVPGRVLKEEVIVMKFTPKLAAAIAASALLVACNTDKVPADTAIKGAETAIAAAKPEAQKYVPDQLKSAEGALQAAKDQFAKGEYKVALTAATELGTKAKELAAAAAAKKDELTKSWNDLAADVPKLVDAVQGKIDQLGKLKKLPKEIDAAKLTTAKDSLAAAKASWQEATAAFGSGNIQDALAKGKTVKEKVAEVAALLGLQAAPPPAAS